MSELIAAILVAAILCSIIHRVAHQPKQTKF